MDVTLKADARREKGSGASRRLRARGYLPAVLYGAGIDGAIPVAVNRRELAAALSTPAGRNALITLEVDGGSHLTLARELQSDPVRRQLLHVDFLAVRRDQEIHAEVNLNFVGEAPASRNDLVVSHPLTSVIIAAKPGDLPDAIDVDVSVLVSDSDTIRAGDVPLPAGVTLVTDPEEPVAAVSSAMDIGLEAAAAEAEAAAGEVPEGAGEAAAAAGESEGRTGGSGGEGAEG